MLLLLNVFRIVHLTATREMALSHVIPAIKCAVELRNRGVR